MATNVSSIFAFPNLAMLGTHETPGRLALAAYYDRARATRWREVSTRKSEVFFITTSTILFFCPF